MSCRRVSREMLERFRFGEELDSRSEPHLAHLQTCAACREEVGLDRALVVQLRRALQQRVADAIPPPGTWQTVRARAVAGEGGWALGDVLTRWVRVLPAAMAVAVMAIAVWVPSAAPVAGPFPSDRSPTYQRVAVAPRWELPWYLRYRTASQVVPSRGGIRAADFTDPVQPNPPDTMGLIE